MKLKTDSSGVAVPPRVRWWLLPVPFIFLVCAIIGFQHAKRFMFESWWWRNAPFYPRSPISYESNVVGHSLMCFVSTAGDVSLVSDDESWDSLSAALSREDGELWTVDVSIESSFACIIVPSFERFNARLRIGSVEESADEARSEDVQRVRNWALREGGEAVPFLRSRKGQELIRSGEHTWLRPLWGYVAVNTGIFGGLLLLPWAVVAWCNLEQRRRYFVRLRSSACVSCRYDLAPSNQVAISRCPECGTLNPPRPPEAGTAPSSSPTPSEQSAPPPPAPQATAQSPPR